MLEKKICKACGHRGIITFDPAYNVEPEHDPESNDLDDALAQAARLAVETRAGLNWTLDMFIVALETELNCAIYGGIFPGDLAGALEEPNELALTDEQYADLRQRIVASIEATAQRANQLGAPLGSLFSLWETALGAAWAQHAEQIGAATEEAGKGDA